MATGKRKFDKQVDTMYFWLKLFLYTLIDSSRLENIRMNEMFTVVMIKEIKIIVIYVPGVINYY